MIPEAMRTIRSSAVRERAVKGSDRQRESVCEREREQSKAVIGRERVCVSERERAVKGSDRQRESVCV